MKTPTVYIIGVGPGDPALVTSQALETISLCPAILSWELNLEPIEGKLGRKKLFLQDVTNYVKQAQRAMDAARDGLQPLGIVRIGDPTVSSGLAGLLAMMPDFCIKVVPGIGAAQVAACRTRIELHRAVLFSFHDDDARNEEEKKFMLSAWRAERHLVLFSGPSMMPGMAARYLLEHGVAPDVSCWVGESLTFPQEREWSGKLAEMGEGSFSWLSVTVVCHPAVGSRPALSREKNLEPRGEL